MILKCYKKNFKIKLKRVLWHACLHTTKRSESLKVLPLEFIHIHVTYDSDCWHQVSQSWVGDR